MEDTAIPYELPEAENHSFFFIDQRVETRNRSKNCIDTMHGSCITSFTDTAAGRAGDTCQPFTAGDVALIPPSMLHRWEYAPESADTDGGSAI